MATEGEKAALLAIVFAADKAHATRVAAEEAERKAATAAEAARAKAEDEKSTAPLKKKHSAITQAAATLTEALVYVGDHHPTTKDHPHDTNVAVETAKYRYATGETGAFTTSAAVTLKWGEKLGPTPKENNFLAGKGILRWLGRKPAEIVVADYHSITAVVGDNVSVQGEESAPGHDQVSVGRFNDGGVSEIAGMMSDALRNPAHVRDVRRRSNGYRPQA